MHAWRLAYTYPVMSLLCDQRWVSCWDLLSHPSRAASPPHQLLPGYSSYTCWSQSDSDQLKDTERLSAWRHQMPCLRPGWDQPSHLPPWSETEMIETHETILEHLHKWFAWLNTEISIQRLFILWHRQVITDYLFGMYCKTNTRQEMCPLWRENAVTAIDCCTIEILINLN